MQSFSSFFLATALALMVCTSGALAGNDYVSFCQRTPALTGDSRFACFKTAGAPPLFGSDALRDASFYSSAIPSAFAIVLNGKDSFVKFAVGQSTVQIEADNAGKGCFSVAITKEQSGVPRLEDIKPHCSGEGAISI